MRRLATTSANTVVVASLGMTIVLMELSRLAAKTRSLWLPPFLNDAARPSGPIRNSR